MGAENLNPLEELKRLDQQVGLVTDLAGLKPIYYRLDEIAKQHANDFEVQLVVGDIKQHLVNRGTKLKDQQAAFPTPPAMEGGRPSGPPTMTLRPTTPLPAPPPMASSPSVGPPPAPTGPTPPPMASPSPWGASAVGTPPPMGPPPPMPSGQFGAPPFLPKPPSSVTPPVTLPPPQGVAPTVPMGMPPPGLPPAAPPPRPPFSAKRALWIGGILGLIIAIAGIGFILMQRKRNQQKLLAEQNPAALQVQVDSTPTGATIKVNGEEKCTAPCSLPLAPGDYQITAFLAGYEPGANGVTVAAGAASSVNIPLEPSPQSLHLLAEGLDGGEITIDNQPAGAVQGGQFVLDRVAAGAHTVKVSGKGGEASFSFEIANGKPPVITGEVSAKNLLAVVVSSFGNTARLVSSAGPLKLAVNGQPQSDAGPGGVDLKGFQAGSDEIVVGEGATQKTMTDAFGPAPMLTAFLKSDKAAAGTGETGTLVISTGEDDVHVFVNNKEQRGKTKGGQLRIPAPVGKVSVRVVKDGFQNPPPQTAEVRKDGQVRVEFQLKRIEQASTPTKPSPIGGNSGAVTISNGTIRVTRSPGGATITYKRPEEAQPHVLVGNQASLAAGAYVFVAKAPGFPDRTERVDLAAGETKSVDLTLMAAVKAPVVPALKVGGMADWEDPSTWSKDGDTWVHKGGGFVLYKLPAKGVFTFTVQLLKGGGPFRGGHIRWCVDYEDSKNYGLFEIDKKTFWAKEVMNGKNKDREKTQHNLDNQKSFSIQIEVTPEHVVHRINNGGQWVILDSWTESERNFTKGKFGFLIQGSDEIGITDFKFVPR